jgi:hypothetical protein
MGDQARVTCYHLDGRCGHALGHEAFDIIVFRRPRKLRGNLASTARPQVRSWEGFAELWSNAGLISQNDELNDFVVKG